MDGLVMGRVTLLAHIHSQYRPVAQLAERPSPKREVVGSIPTWPASTQETPSIKVRRRPIRKTRSKHVADKNAKEKKPNAIQKLWRETMGNCEKSPGQHT